MGEQNGNCQFYPQNKHFSNSPLEAPTQNWPLNLPWGMGSLQGKEKVDREEGRDRNQKTDTTQIIQRKKQLHVQPHLNDTRADPEAQKQALLT